MENERYPIPRIFCGAHTRIGGVCRQPAMKNGRCRLHGGESKSGKEHGRYRHGMRTKEMMEHRRQMRAILQASKKIITDISKIEMDAVRILAD